MAGVPEENAAFALEQAKARLVSISDYMDALSPVRRHPWRGVGVALAAGLGFGMLTRAKRPSTFPGIIPLALQLSMLLVRWGMKTSGTR